MWQAFFLKFDFFLSWIKKLLVFGSAGSLWSCGLFSVCREQTLLSSGGAWASHWHGFSCCRAWALGCAGFSSCGFWAQWLWFLDSTEQAQELGHTGSVALQHVGSSWIRDRTGVSCIERRSLYHWTIRESPKFVSGVFFWATIMNFIIIFSHTVQIVASYFPHQGLNPGHHLKAWSPNHWTSREFPIMNFNIVKTVIFLLGCLLSSLRNICIYVFSIFF